MNIKKPDRVFIISGVLISGTLLLFLMKEMDAIIANILAACTWGVLAFLFIEEDLGEKVGLFFVFWFIGLFATPMSMLPIALIWRLFGGS